ncbi:ATP-binding cassette domain-containing protein [Chloroflexota bacterium]
MDSELMIETRNLTKSFGDFKAVDGIDMAVKRGSIHGFVGPNGAGKTTTIKVLIGALRSNGGESFIMGHPAGSLDARRLIGYAPERCNFYNNMNAVDYLIYMALVCGVKKSDGRERGIQLLKWLDLEDFQWSKVGGFSAGMRQRLGLAQSLIHEPELLILDEPTANMDPTGRISILDKLRQICKERNVTIFLSSHILSELEQVADSLTLINKGRIVGQGNINDLRKRFSENQFLLKTTDNAPVLDVLKSRECVREGWIEDDFIHLSSDDGTALKYAIAEAVNQSNAIIEHLSEERTSLQDIYRRTMVDEEGEEQSDVS